MFKKIETDSDVKLQLFGTKTHGTPILNYAKASYKSVVKNQKIIPIY